MLIFISFTSNRSPSQFNQFIYLNFAHLVLHMYDFIIIKLNSKNTQLDRLHWIFNVFHEETSNYVEVRNNGGMEEEELEVDPPRRSSDHHHLLAFFVTCVPAEECRCLCHRLLADAHSSVAPADSTISPSPGLLFLARFYSSCWTAVPGSKLCFLLLVGELFLG